MDQEKIGNLIKKIRKDNNLTQAELADKLGVTYQAVSKWENGKNIPDIAILKQISDEFNINLDDLLNGEHNIQEEKKIKKLLIPGLIMFILMISTIVILAIINHNDSPMKKFNSPDSNFEITGTVAKIDNKMYIYISKIEYLDEEDEKVYDKIKVTLYEEYKDKSTKIKEADKVGTNTTLKEYLKEVTFNIDDYKSSCKDITKATLYLKIETTKDSKTINQEIPLELQDLCPSD